MLRIQIPSLTERQLTYVDAFIFKELFPEAIRDKGWNRFCIVASIIEMFYWSTELEFDYGALATFEKEVLPIRNEKSQHSVISPLFSWLGTSQTMAWAFIQLNDVFCLGSLPSSIADQSCSRNIYWNNDHARTTPRKLIAEFMIRFVMTNAILEVVTRFEVCEAYELRNMPYSSPRRWIV